MIEAVRPGVEDWSRGCEWWAMGGRYIGLAERLLDEMATLVLAER